MLGRAKTAALIEFAIGKSRADQTEVFLTRFESSLTRFANSEIHQNVAEHNAALSVRAVIGTRIGVAATNDLGRASVTATVAAAYQIARRQAENPDFPGLPRAKRSSYAHPRTYVARTHEFSAAARAEAVRAIIEIAKADKLRAFGSFTNGFAETAVGNSLGTFAYNQATDAFCNVSMLADDSSGYAEGASRDVRAVNAAAIARRAAEKAVRGRRPQHVEPGVYTVILEPLAAAELFGFLGAIGFGAKHYQEGRSFMCEAIGKPVCAPEITVVDDALDERGFAFPFDFEGVAKQRVPLISRGVARGLVYDSMTAAKAKRASTGHGLPAPNPYGPYPSNIVVRPGRASLDELIRTTAHGLLVTRFHYTNTVEPKKTVITGMTRDGTFLVQDGAIVCGVHNLRFTESILDTLKTTSGLTRALTLVGGGAGYGGRFATGTLTPALRLDRFTFTSKTEF